jgi:ammonium transporter Rh
LNLGTLFLWLFWPSFNSAIASSAANGHHRAVVNTLLSISTSSIVAFFISSAVHKRRFEVMDIQNATLAGGVAIGASANLYTTPWGAMFVGLVSGSVSTLGYARLLPYLLEKINLYDTCGVHNLHGMPGIIGGVASAIFAGLATTSNCAFGPWCVCPADLSCEERRVAH